MKNILIVLIVLLLLLLGCKTPTAPERTIYQTNRAASNGDNWQLLYSLPTLIGKFSVRLTDISCNDNGDIFVSTSGGGVYKINSADSLSKQITNGLIPINVENYVVYFAGSILFSRNRIIVGSSNLIEKGGIFITDNENSFQSKIIWDKYSVVVSLYKNPNGELFAGCYNDILQSKDNGDSWINLTSNTEDGFGYFYSFSFDKYGNIYGATSRGVYYSDSRKISFKVIGLSNEAILGIDINKEGWIYASTESGKLFYSKDSGANWEQLMNYPNKQAHCIYINDNYYIIAGAEDGIYRSKDNGNTWEFVGLKDKRIIRIVPDTKGGLIAGTYMNEIYYSSN